MDQRNLLIVAVIVIAVIAIFAVIIFSRKRRRQHLRETFGSEYDRVVQQRGDQSRAEAELFNREKRVNSFSLKTLSRESRSQYAEEWAAVQRHFVDDPSMAVTEADALVNRVMSARGYPMADFEQRAADISVSHPAVVEKYRAARAIVHRHSQGEAGTEDLRQAMVHYRYLFAELLDTTKSVAA